MYMCVHSATSRCAGQVQVVQESDIVPVCDTYKFFKRNRQELTQFAQELSQSWYSVRSATSKRGTETKKVFKPMCTEEGECVLV